MSAGRVGPAHPSPLSQLAGQQQWAEDEEKEGLGTGPGPKRRAEEDEASPSPGSSDTDGERSADSDGEARRRAATMKRTRSRKNSNAHPRWLKSRSQSATVASLAAPMVSPARSSPSRAPTGSPKRRSGSQSSVETVIAASVREQGDEVGLVGSGKDLVVDKGPACWAEMSHRRKVAVVEEEHQLREAGWRALREALEEFADEVGHPLSYFEARMVLKRWDLSGRRPNVRDARVGGSRGTQAGARSDDPVRRGLRR
jgi:hypothetical protein